jgi:hypothetical protein
MHRNAALARLRSKLAKKLGSKKLSKASLKRAGLRVTKTGKIVRKKTIFDDDDEKLALEKEIRLLEKLIGQGRKIWSALPEKEARLAALRKKIAEMAKGKAKAAAKKKLKALLALLDKVNDKIEGITARPHPHHCTTTTCSGSLSLYLSLFSPQQQTETAAQTQGCH